MSIQLFFRNLGKYCISRDTVGVKSYKCLSLPRREDCPSPQGGRCMMKRSFLAKNSWIGFLQLSSVQKQIVGSNLGLPATQTHQSLFHELTQLSALNSCVLIQYRRYKGSTWVGIVPLYSVVYKRMPLLCAWCYHWLWNREKYETGSFCSYR